jgi:hypothetical protein
VLSLRTADGYDVRAQMTPGARRELERADGVTVGHQQIRIDTEAAGDRWREVLAQALEAAAGPEAA